MGETMLSGKSEKMNCVPVVGKLARAPPASPVPLLSAAYAAVDQITISEGPLIVMHERPWASSPVTTRRSGFMVRRNSLVAIIRRFTLEVITWRGLVRYFVLFVIDLKTRRIEIAGIVASPDGRWMCQIARNLTDGEDGFLLRSRYPIHDRDPLFTKGFQEILDSSGVRLVKLPSRSATLNDSAARFVRSINSERWAHM